VLAACSPPRLRDDVALLAVRLDDRSVTTKR
jgi:hypothetical protein